MIWTNKIASGGIISWRFIAIFVLNQLSFKIKYQLEFDEGYVDEDTYATNLFTVSVLGIILGLISMRRVTGSLKAVLALWLQFPPLLLLPMFGFVTFGPTPKGETLYGTYL